MTELGARRRILVLAICCLSLLIVGMDTTIVNVALPAIRIDLGVSVSGLQWTVDAYTVVLASLLILSGSTADRVGRRRTFQTGLLLFTVGSLACSLAPSLAWLVAFRMLQAVGGSMLNPVALSIITNVFTEPRERARAIGIWGGVVGLSFGLGPVIGGLLVETVGWRAIFWINVPIGIAAFVLAALFVPESRADRPRRVDPVGQVLIIGILGAVTYAIIDAPHSGWLAPQTGGLLVVGAVALAAFLGYERRRREPLIELGFFRSAPFTGATVIAVAVFATFGGFLFLSTIYLQDVRGLSALRAGAALLPVAVMTLVFAPLSGRLVGSRGPRIPLVVSGVGLAAASILLTRVHAHTAMAQVVGAYAVFGFGFGFANPPITNTAVSGMPREQAGVAAAIASTSRQVGATLGVAVFGAIIATHAGNSTRSVTAGFARSASTAWWIGAGLGLVVAVLALVTTGPWARSTAQSTARELQAAAA